ncbi:hypothetical protein PCH_Pc16g04190 [Penicillium rubens Wisconsin 54-1255]|uniref:Uncharacterized protein n=1 Tax=Penicillium rubens (strain ATCC 28089 / DSM 1075 / NRRL 1951 / Wisconsin 54-1255) TaxID=500485 RepID=B6H8F1_PENRW|nr:hypothetical protein PCH_Pc16g04190 [Penicillium rubens Wisconsin 54-1255]
MTPPFGRLCSLSSWHIMPHQPTHKMVSWSKVMARTVLRTEYIIGKCERHGHGPVVQHPWIGTPYFVKIRGIGGSAMTTPGSIRNPGYFRRPEYFGQKSQVAELCRSINVIDPRGHPRVSLVALRKGLWRCATISSALHITLEFRICQFRGASAPAGRIIHRTRHKGTVYNMIGRAIQPGASPWAWSRSELGKRMRTQPAVM